MTHPASRCAACCVHQELVCPRYGAEFATEEQKDLSRHSPPRLGAPTSSRAFSAALRLASAHVSATCVVCVGRQCHALGVIRQQRKAPTILWWRGLRSHSWNNPLQVSPWSEHMPAGDEAKPPPTVLGLNLCISCCLLGRLLLSPAGEPGLCLGATA
jgi:hypothetical protein